MKLTVLGSNRTEVSFKNGLSVLFSYNTPVAAKLPRIGCVKTEKHWSRTTSRHITQSGYATDMTVTQEYLDNLLSNVEVADPLTGKLG